MKKTLVASMAMVMFVGVAFLFTGCFWDGDDNQTSIAGEYICDQTNFSQTQMDNLSVRVLYNNDGDIVSSWENSWHAPTINSTINSVKMKLNDDGTITLSGLAAYFGIPTPTLKYTFENNVLTIKNANDTNWSATSGMWKRTIFSASYNATLKQITICYQFENVNLEGEQGMYITLTFTLQQ
ncbi:MAG: hypothetical protein LBN07_02190 [Christensenellaceae bacterium]|jgi:hypothetical protein|nr:hypothetical protein [Christensenellaceae bacterium]